MTEGRFSASGEQFVCHLVEFFDRRSSDLMSGKLVLQLHPRALEYIAARLQYFEELEAMKASSPVDYFRGAFANLQEYKRLEKLQHILQRVKRLRLMSVVFRHRDPTRVNLAGLWSLASLEMRSCDLSTSVIAGLEALQGTLVHVSCSDSLEKLQHLLAPASRTGSTLPPALWPKLTSLSCTHNSFSAMDASLTLAPALQTLCLCSNNIRAPANLHLASSLTELRLSHNCLTSLGTLLQCPGGLQVLHLQGNAIGSTADLAGLHSLVELDLRYNLLASLADVSHLSGLSNLRSLGLEGNPIAYAPFYRVDALQCLPQCACGLVLDGRPVHTSESEALATHALFRETDVSPGMHALARYISQPDHWGSTQHDDPFKRRLASAVQDDATMHAASPPSSQASMPGSSHRPVRRIVDLGGRTQSALLRREDDALASLGGMHRPLPRSQAQAAFEASRYDTHRRAGHSRRRRAIARPWPAQSPLPRAPSLGQSNGPLGSSPWFPLSKALARDLEGRMPSTDLDSQASSSLHGSSASFISFSSPDASPERDRTRPSAQSAAPAANELCQEPHRAAGSTIKAW
ncbi:hypothetical protein WJX73_002772 [Symbiochloris irregularis]|uniref:Uncharacterized protein n=1 Tax=Symbiochloris irregularis TaxID=706552 RepID=A0AAW1PPM1_9CHLO